MQPELIRIFGLPIYSYGLMLIIGFLLASQLAKYLARRVGQDPEIYVNAGLIALLAGVIGARQSHVLENLDQYTLSQLSFGQNLWNAINLTDGGLTFYGGFIFATPILMLYGWYMKVNILRGMDVVAPCLMVGLALGRVGCFLNGCCYGEVCHTDGVPSVSYPYGSNAYIDQYRDGRLPQPPADELRGDAPGEIRSRRSVEANPALASIAADHRSAPTHPSQLYSTLTSLLVAGICVAYFSTSPLPGRVFGLMLILEGMTRFILEMLRVEPPVLGSGTANLTFLPAMSYSMVLGALIFLIGIVMWTALGLWRRPNTNPPPILPASSRAA